MLPEGGSIFCFRFAPWSCENSDGLSLRIFQNGRCCSSEITQSLCTQVWWNSFPWFKSNTVWRMTHGMSPPPPPTLQRYEDEHKTLQHDYLLEWWGIPRLFINCIDYIVLNETTPFTLSLEGLLGKWPSPTSRMSLFYQHLFRCRRL